MEILNKKWLEKETIILSLHHAVILQNNRRTGICQFALTIERSLQKRRIHGPYFVLSPLTIALFTEL